MTVQPLILANLLGRTWWLELLRGLAAILFGALALLWPHLTLMILVVLYAVYALSDGAFALASAVRGGGLFPAGGWSWWRRATWSRASPRWPGRRSPPSCWSY